MSHVVADVHVFPSLQSHGSYDQLFRGHSLIKNRVTVSEYSMVLDNPIEVVPTHLI